MVRRSLEPHGQLAAATLFAEPGGLEIIDGFKRVRAARALGRATLVARIDNVGPIDAKLRLRELHDRRGLTALQPATKPAMDSAITNATFSAIPDQERASQIIRRSAMMGVTGVRVRVVVLVLCQRGTS